MPKMIKYIAVVIAIFSISLMGFTVLSFANPDDAVPATDDGSVRIGTYNSNSSRSDDDNNKNIDGQVRDEQGILSQLNTTTHNPYNGQIRLDIDIGAEFADYEGSDVTEGIRLKVSRGGTITLPKVHAKEGYYFIGWGQGGVPEEPTWDINTEKVIMGTDTSNGKNTTIYALYANENGDGYCTCGAYEEGIYKDKMDEIKAASAEYNQKNFGFTYWISQNKLVIIISALSITVIALLIIILDPTKKKGTSNNVPENITNKQQKVEVIAD